MLTKLVVPLALGVTLAGASATAAGLFPFAHQTHTLDNGLTVITIPMPVEGLVAYYSVVRTGSRDEVEPGHSGFAHFFEHMMFRGTEKYPGPVYDRLITSMGADANAYTTDDYTCYHLNLASEDLPRVIELEADRFQNLSYAEREFQTESGAVYGEYRKGRTSPFQVLFEALQNAAFDVHTYKHTTIGFEADVAAMPTMYDYSKSFFRRFYRPENVVLVIAGDFDEGRTMALIEQHYGAWKPGYQAPQVPSEPEQKKARRVAVAYEGRTLPLVATVWKGPRFDPSDREMVAGSLLGELAFGETSDLYRELVLDKRIAQRLMASFDMSRDPGLWGAIAMVSGEQHLETVEDAIVAAAARMRENPPSPERLDAVKRNFRYSFVMGMETPDDVAGGLARFVALTGGIEAVDAFFAVLDTVTPEDVQKAAQHFLTDQRRSVAVLTGVQR